MFSVSPSFGMLPANTASVFELVYQPTRPGQHRSRAQLFLESIPMESTLVTAMGGRAIWVCVALTLRMPLDNQVGTLQPVSVSLQGECEPCSAVAVPPVLAFAGALYMGQVRTERAVGHSLWWPFTHCDGCLCLLCVSSPIGVRSRCKTRATH